jgi:hypothetical protein
MKIFWTDLANLLGPFFVGRQLFSHAGQLNSALKTVPNLKEKKILLSHFRNMLPTCDNMKNN